jgi:hypothetical protein
MFTLCCFVRKRFGKRRVRNIGTTETSNIAYKIAAEKKKTKERKEQE